MPVTYKKGYDTRLRILDAAYESFARFGFHGTSLREIAAACGISHPGIRHHFESKEELLIEVLRQRDTKIYADAAARIDKEGFSIAAIIGIVRDSIDNPQLSSLFLSMSAQAINPEHPAHEYFTNRYSQMLALYTEYIGELKKAGGVHESIDPAEAAVLVMSLMDGAQLQGLLAPNNSDLDKILDDGIRKITGAIYLDEVPVRPIKEFTLPILRIHT